MESDVPGKDLIRDGCIPVSVSVEPTASIVSREEYVVCSAIRARVHVRVREKRNGHPTGRLGQLGRSTRNQFG